MDNMFGKWKWKLQIPKLVFRALYNHLFSEENQLKLVASPCSSTSCFISWIYDCFACTFACKLVPGARGSQSRPSDALEVKVQKVVKLPCWSWELNSNLLKEEWEFITAEPFFQSITQSFKPSLFLFIIKLTQFP